MRDQDGLITELPDFSARVIGELSLPIAKIEMCEYRSSQAQTAFVRMPSCRLDFALSPRFRGARGRYGEEAGGSVQAIGEVVLIPANQLFRAEWQPGIQRSICCIFDRDEAGELEWESWELEASLDVRSPEIRDLMVRVAREISAPSFGSRLMVETACIQLKIELERYYGHCRPSLDETRRGKLSTSQMRRIEEWIDESRGNLGISQLAAEFGFSARHLARLFRATTGTTLSSFTADRQLGRAKVMLAGRERVKTVAWACGFDTAAGFSIAFRRATGLSPRDYKRQFESRTTRLEPEHALETAESAPVMRFGPHVLDQRDTAGMLLD